MSAARSLKTRPPKKSETLEIRLDHDAKAAFMARCRSEGRTASEALRGFIAGDTAPQRRVSRARRWAAGAAVLAGLAIGAAAAPSLAQSVSKGADREAFQRLDRDGDGVLSLAEFSRR